MFFATARQKRRWYHHIRPPPDARWTNVDSGRMLYPPPSLCLNVFLLLLFRSIEKIFSWRCDSHLQGDMRRGDGATVLSGTTIAVDVDAMRRRVKKLRFFAPVEDDDDVWSAHDGGWWSKIKRGFFHTIGIWIVNSLKFSVFIISYWILIWIKGHYPMAFPTYNIYIYECMRLTYLNGLHIYCIHYTCVH